MTSESYSQIRRALIGAILSLASPAILAEEPRAKPSVGDQWGYEVWEPTHPDRKYQLSVVVTEVAESFIRDVSTIPDVFPISSEHTAIPQLVGVRPGLATFLPYARAFQDLQSNILWAKVDYQQLWTCSTSTELVCSADGRVVGREQVSVRAGNYDAWKLVVNLRMYGQAGMHGEFVFWYADEVRRVVKYQSRFRVASLAGARHWPIPDIDMELLSYRPAVSK